MIVTTFDTLNQYVQAFAERKISLLVIRSEGGLSKTYTLRHAIKEDESLFFEGHATPLSIYLRMQTAPKNLVIFDDVDSLLANKTSLALLKQVCEIEDDKTVRYDTTQQINKNIVEPSFVSNNKVCLLCNDIKRVGRHMKALLTRGIYIDFEPTHEEILNVMEKFNELDKEIFDYLKLHHAEISELNLRVYFKCIELKNAKINWHGYLKGEFHINQELELAIQLADLPLQERNARWEAETGKTARTLQRLLAEWRSRNV